MSYAITLTGSSSSPNTATLDASTQTECRTQPGDAGTYVSEASATNVAEVEDVAASERLLQGIGGALAKALNPVPQEQPNLSNIPVEVKLHIISFIGDDSEGLYTKACLALTCSKMYHAYKTVHPEPIAWDVGPALIDDKGHSWEYALQHHIGVFLGPAYRRHRFDPRFVYPFKKWPAFLSRKVYGSIYNMKEIELNNRYSDWGGWSTKTEPKLFEVVKSLPSPFGLGEEWYGLATKAVRNLYVNRSAGSRAVSAGVKRLPTYLFVYKLMMREYEEFYDGFAEWIVMMGL
ncbi:hypothetical protein BKA64DRAFT_765184 [Cadophora sp. MPI-SDFR-AT-0126]|nr:hypothetical protein BKA64DRAFT_765184 [Leotiomycetes sp. MPI-SDFR-AT-0126]